MRLKIVGLELCVIRGNMDCSVRKEYGSCCPQDYTSDPAQLESARLIMENHVKEMIETAPTHFMNSEFHNRLKSCEDYTALLKHKSDEDGRLDFLLRMKKTMNETFDNPAFIHPHGMTAHDYKSIPDFRKKGLEAFKVIRMASNF